MNKDKSLKKKNNLGDNFMNIILDDLKHSNNLVLKNLIFENKVYFSYIDQEGILNRIKFDQNLFDINSKNKIEVEE